MKLRNIAAISCTLFSLSHINSVMAQGTVVAKVGTLGAGLEYVHPISPKIAVGFGLNGLSYSDNIEESDINYDADLNMQTISLLGDYHPWGNGFKISGGIMNNGNQFDLTGTPTGDEEITIGDSTKRYQAEDIGSLTATIGFKSMAPYLGIGWGRAPQSGKGWGFDADLGVLFQGKPDISFAVTCGQALIDSDQVDDGTRCADLKADVEKEEADLETDSDEFDMFPVISLGVSYSF